jgi:hypothetical protein
MWKPKPGQSKETASVRLKDRFKLPEITKYGESTLKLPKKLSSEIDFRKLKTEKVAISTGFKIDRHKQLTNNLDLNERQL